MVSGQYTVLSSSDQVYFASNLVDTNLRRVDLDTVTYSCAFNDQFAISCRHLMAVLRFYNAADQAFSAFDSRYTVSSYAEAFKGQPVELVLDVQLSPNPAIKPSSYFKRAGRRRHRGYKGRGEEGHGKTYVCKQCGKSGHNRATCYGFVSGSSTVRVEFGSTVISGSSSESEGSVDSDDGEQSMSQSGDDEDMRMCIGFILS